MCRPINNLFSLGGIMKQFDDATKAGYVGNTTRFKRWGDPDNPIYDDGEFIVVQGEWRHENLPDDEIGEESVGCRWYGFDPSQPEDKQGKGYPNGFGRAQWMILPKYIGLLLIADDIKRQMKAIKDI